MSRVVVLPPKEFLAIAGEGRAAQAEVGRWPALMLWWRLCACLLLCLWAFVVHAVGVVAC